MAESNTIRYIKYAFLFTAFFIVYNTLIPFRIYTDPGKIFHNITEIEWIPFFNEGRLNSLTDIIGNLLLFMPFGYFLYLYREKSKQRQALILKTVIAGFLLSVSIETAQIFFRYRIPSVTDIITNTTGTSFGILAARIYMRHVTQHFHRALSNILKNEPVTLVLILIVLLQLFNSALPFNVSITVSDLKRSIAYSNITPFGMEPLGLVFGKNIKKLTELHFSWTAFFGNVMFYTFYGYLLLYSYKRYWKGKRYAFIRLVVLLLLFFPGIELLQFFIRSRFSDVNDIISGYLGAGIGCALFMAVKKDSWFKEEQSLNLSHFNVLVFLYFIYVFYKGFSPFSFTFDEQVVSQNLTYKNLVPFYAYYKVTSLWNIYDILETFFLTMPLGIIMAIRNRSKLAEGTTGKKILMAGFSIGIIIELAQVFLRTRTGDITDVFFMGAGAYLGLLFYRYYDENYVNNKSFVDSLNGHSFDPDATFS